MLNKESLERLDAIRSIFFKKIIAQSTLLIATILRVISLRNKFVLKIEISSSSLFAKSLIDNLVINQLAKFALHKSYIFYINSPTRRKSAKTR
jgi:hypothetical protein